MTCLDESAYYCVFVYIVNYYNKDPTLTAVLANTRSKRLTLVTAGISTKSDLYNAINIRNRSQSASTILATTGGNSSKNIPRKLSSGHIQLINQLSTGGRVSVSGGVKVPEDSEIDRCMVCGHAGVTNNKQNSHNEHQLHNNMKMTDKANAGSRKTQLAVGSYSSVLQNRSENEADGYPIERVHDSMTVNKRSSCIIM